MATEDNVDTTSAHVQTYVPEYQKDEWAREADAMNMTLSEFVRSMVQAGRSDVAAPVAQSESGENAAAAATPSSGPEPQGKGLEDRVVDILAADEYYEWGELVEALTADVEERLEETLQELQAEGAVQHSGRHGGYTLV